MPSLTDRYYEMTIPAYGPAPAPEERHPLSPTTGERREASLDMLLEPLRREVERLGEVFAPFTHSCTEVSPKFEQFRLDVETSRQIELHAQVMHKCSGQRRRQMRRRKRWFRWAGKKW